MKKGFLLLFIPLLLNSCKNNSETESSVATENTEKINQLKWLLGTWTNENGEEFSQETWAQENPSTFSGFSFTQVGKETVFAETMALEQKADSLLLTVATANQNEKKPVTFRMVSSANGQFTFENKNHDFPQRIVYTNPKKDSLLAWIEGTENGEVKRIDFSYSRKE